MPETLDLNAFGPNIIGATGGSGTRVIARISRAGGMFIGTHLNESEDALDLGEFSDRWINTFLARNGSHHPDLEAQMTQDFHSVVRKHCASLPASSSQPWGWKEPRSIYLLPFLHSQFPRLKFLHLIRDGRDMAYSANQNQLKKHGTALLRWSERFGSPSLRSMLVWSRINQRGAEYGERNLRDKYLRVRFEDLCADPVPIVQRILDFFGLEGDAEIIAREVNPPDTIGRWRKVDDRSLPKLCEAGEAALREFGYLDG